MPEQGTFSAWQQSTPVKTQFGAIAQSQLQYLTDWVGQQEANKARAKLMAQQQAMEMMKMKQAQDKEEYDRLKESVLENKYQGRYGQFEYQNVIEDKTNAIALLNAKYKAGGMSQIEYRMNLEGIKNDAVRWGNLFNNRDKEITELLEGIKNGQYDDTLNYKQINNAQDEMDGNFTMITDPNTGISYSTKRDKYGIEYQLDINQEESRYKQREKPIDENKKISDVIGTYKDETRYLGGGKTTVAPKGTSAYNFYDNQYFKNAKTIEDIDVMIPPEIRKAFLKTHQKGEGLFLEPSEVFKGENGVAQFKDWAKNYILNLASTKDSSVSTLSDPTEVVDLEAKRNKNKKDSQPDVIANVTTSRQFGKKYQTTTYSVTDPEHPFIVGTKQVTDVDGTTKTVQLTSPSVSINDNGTYEYILNDGTRGSIVGEQGIASINAQLANRKIKHQTGKTLKNFK